MEPSHVLPQPKGTGSVQVRGRWPYAQTPVVVQPPSLGVAQSPAQQLLLKHWSLAVHGLRSFILHGAIGSPAHGAPQKLGAGFVQVRIRLPNKQTPSVVQSPSTFS